MIFSHCAIRFERQASRYTGIFVTDILKKSMRTDWRINGTWGRPESAEKAPRIGSQGTRSATGSPITKWDAMGTMMEFFKRARNAPDTRNAGENPIIEKGLKGFRVNQPQIRRSRLGGHGMSQRSH